MNRRENTFRVDYSNVPKKPSFEELHKFVAESLGLKRGEVERIQCNRALGCAFVKVNDLELAQRIVEDHDNKHEIVCDDKSYRVRIIMEDGAVEVKLTDLSEAVTNGEIEEYLCEYGEVLSIRDVLWDNKFVFGGIPTGVRVAKMILDRNIASYVTISGETTHVMYFGQKQTCRHCSEFVHNGISCVQNKKLMVQKSYADAAKMPYNNTGPKGPRTRTKQSTGQNIGSASFPTLPPQSKPGVFGRHENQPAKSNTMPPPSGAGFTKFTRQRARTGLNSESTEKAADGNDTDTSATSTGSRRSKKLRTDNGTTEQREEDMSL